MSGRQRWVLVSTGLVLAVLAGALTLLSWDRANQVAGVISALVGVAGLGTSVWAAMAGSGTKSAVISDTGAATSTGGMANTGFIATSTTETPHSLTVRNTGNAESESGDANTGFQGN
ncbi:hypothetical protein GCM10010121_055950 [Streptomyces brasiliensis]|uniref:Uncharacterized protein n=1 Tax=Streptomyces brasiliensis TaxID=1954 RepID=A0A917KZJ9_9ACTN|nr:hypothetical protein GCM10010121_055950 [Streptomyces brasiliensis]